jgi:hypothetical protein
MNTIYLDLRYIPRYGTEPTPRVSNTTRVQYKVQQFRCYRSGPQASAGRARQTNSSRKQIDYQPDSSADFSTVYLLV